LLPKEQHRAQNNLYENLRPAHAKACWPLSHEARTFTFFKSLKEKQKQRNEIKQRQPHMTTSWYTETHVQRRGLTLQFYSQLVTQFLAKPEIFGLTENYFGSLLFFFSFFPKGSVTVPSEEYGQ